MAEGTVYLAPQAFHTCSFLDEVELPWTLDEDVNYYKNNITDEEYEEKYMDSTILFWDVDKLDTHQREAYDKAWHELFDGHEFIIPFTTKIIHWDHPYAQEYLETHCSLQAFEESWIDEYGVRYSKDGKRLLCMTFDFDKVEEYYVRPGVQTICDDAFLMPPDVNGYYHPLTVHLPDTVEQIGYNAFPLFYRKGNDFIFNHELANDPGFWEEYFRKNLNIRE